MSDDLRKAAQAVLDRWDSPKWEWISHGPTADLMTALRAALAAAQPPAAMPVPADVLRDAGRYRWLEEHTVATGLSRWIDDHRTQFLGVAVDEELAATPQAQSVPATGAQPWQPIETAPRDGRKIIVAYVNRNSKVRTVMARWMTDEQAAETDSDGVGLEGGWYECIDNWDDYTEVAIHEGEPEHWMPLPTAPTGSATPQGDSNG